MKKIARLHPWDMISRTIRIAAAALVVMVLVLGAGIYFGNWHGSRTAWLSQWIAWPAATLVGQTVTYTDFIQMSSGVDHYRQKNPQQYAQATGRPTTEPAAVAALDELIRQLATERLAADHGAKVSSDQVQQAYNAQVVQGGDATQSAGIINNLYGWSPAEFQRYILRTSLVRSALQEKLSFDDSLNQDSHRQTETVLKLVETPGQDFAELAKKYSRDQYAANGGDMDWVAQGELTAELDQAIFALAVGQTSKIIHTAYGWHILKAEAKRSTQDQPQVQVRQIFIPAPSVDGVVRQFLSNQKIHVWVPGLTWDQPNAKVIQRS